MWDALTWQGKSVVAGLLFAILIVYLVLARQHSQPQVIDRSLSQPSIGQNALSSAPPAATASSTPQPALPAALLATARPAVPTPPPTEPATATAPAAPSTAVPTRAPPPPSPTDVPEEPQATAIPAGCLVAASVSNSSPAIGSVVALTARLTCGGAGVGGAQMTGIVSYKNGQSHCTGVSDLTGSASCGLPVAGATVGLSVSIDACFTNQAQVYCGQTGFTPH